MNKAKNVLGTINEAMGITEDMLAPDGRNITPTYPYAVLAKDRPPRSGEYYYIESGVHKDNPSLDSPKMRVAQTFTTRGSAGDWADRMNMPPGTNKSKKSSGIYYSVAVRGRLLKMK